MKIKVPDNVPQPTKTICWKPQPLDQGMARCDRVAGHLGPHTWEKCQEQSPAPRTAAFRQT